MCTTNTESDVRCNKCQGSFNISSRGAADIVRHLDSDRHKAALTASAGSQPLTSFFFTASPEDQHTAACEATWAYHTIKENHSFRSADCATKIFKSCFRMLIFTCSHSKCEAIVTNVLAPFAVQMLKEDLKEVRFVSLLTDSSNHGNVKMMPVLARYFVPTRGSKVKILDFTSQKGETSVIIVQFLNETVDAWDLGKKFVCFGADNTNTNFFLPD